MTSPSGLTPPRRALLAASGSCLAGCGEQRAPMGYDAVERHHTSRVRVPDHGPEIGDPSRVWGQPRQRERLSAVPQPAGDALEGEGWPTVRTGPDRSSTLEPSSAPGSMWGRPPPPPGARTRPKRPGTDEGGSRGRAERAGSAATLALDAPGQPGAQGRGRFPTSERSGDVGNLPAALALDVLSCCLSAVHTSPASWAASRLGAAVRQRLRALPTIPQPFPVCQSPAWAHRSSSCCAKDRTRVPTPAQATESNFGSGVPRSNGAGGLCPL